ncbi:hypothetical protein K470DRAFT_217790, partial [Piedraia hortae CBS 480.64]
VRALGTPTLLFTFSAAYMQWHSLMRLMPEFGGWVGGDSRTRYTIARINLCDCPHIATQHFLRRFQSVS